MVRGGYSRRSTFARSTPDTLNPSVILSRGGGMKTHGLQLSALGRRLRAVGISSAPETGSSSVTTEASPLPNYALGAIPGHSREGALSEPVAEALPGDARGGDEAGTFIRGHRAAGHSRRPSGRWTGAAEALRTDVTLRYKFDSADPDVRAGVRRVSGGAMCRTWILRVGNDNLDNVDDLHRRGHSGHLLLGIISPGHQDGAKTRGVLMDKRAPPQPGSPSSSSTRRSSWTTPP